MIENVWFAPSTFEAETCLDLLFQLPRLQILRLQTNHAPLSDFIPFLYLPSLTTLITEGFTCIGGANTNIQDWNFASTAIKALSLSPVDMHDNAKFTSFANAFPELEHLSLVEGKSACVDNATVSFAISAFEKSFATSLRSFTVDNFYKGFCVRVHGVLEDYQSRALSLLSQSQLTHVRINTNCFARALPQLRHETMSIAPFLPHTLRTLELCHTLLARISQYAVSMQSGRAYCEVQCLLIIFDALTHRDLLPVLDKAVVEAWDTSIGGLSELSQTVEAMKQCVQNVNGIDLELIVKANVSDYDGRREETLRCKYIERRWIDAQDC